MFETDPIRGAGRTYFTGPSIDQLQSKPVVVRKDSW
jgi:hypothetical protein